MANETCYNLTTFNLTESGYNKIICFAPLEFVHILTIALSGILLVAIVFVILSKLPAIVSEIKYRRKRRRFVRHTNVRSSRNSSRGGAAFVRSQDQQQQSMQLPIYQNRFEYVDMLAETPTTVRTLSEDNLIETARSTLERGQSTSVDPLLALYDDPDSVQTHGRERSMTQRNDPRTIVTPQERARSRTIHQFPRSVSHHGQANTSVHFERGATARESTRSMPGEALNSTRQQRQRTQTVSVSTPFQRSSQRTRDRVRSMFDPLPDIPTGGSPVTILNPSESVDSNIDVEIAIIASTDANTSNQLSAIPPVSNRVSQAASEKQFSFEDGTLMRSDIPPFCDPEFCEEPESENPEVSIYSSQILETKAHDTANDDLAVNDNTTEDLYDRLDRPVPTHPPPPPPPPESKRSQPEGAFQIRVKSDTPRNIEISGPLEEALYDTPMVVVTKPLPDVSTELSLKDVTDPKLLFDDPGYTEGMMAAKLAPTHLYQNVPLIVEDSNRQTTVNSEPVSRYNDEESTMRQEVVTDPRLELQDEESMGESSSSLSVQLDYDEDELDDLDPDIASCLAKERVTFV